MKIQVKVLILLILFIPAASLTARPVFEFDGYLLYLRPSSSQQTLGSGIVMNRDPAPAKSYLYVSDFSFGFRVGGYATWDCSQIFAGGGVTWFDGKHTTTKTGVLREDELKGFEGFSPPAQAVSVARGTDHTRYVAADVELGMPLACCARLKTSLFGGVRYTDINIQAIGHYIPPNEQEQVTYYTQFNTRFHGIGPRMGLDFRLPVYRCLSFLGRLSSSMLFATRPIDFRTQTNYLGEVNGNQSNRNHLTWALDGKIGVRLCASWCRLGHFFIEGGMLLDFIFDGVQSLQGIPTVALIAHSDPVPSGKPNLVQKVIPFAIGGPYGKIGWCF